MTIEILYEDGHKNPYDQSGNYAYDVEMQDGLNHFQRPVSMTAYNEHQSQQARNEEDNDTGMEGFQNELKGFIILVIGKQLDTATEACTLDNHPRIGQQLAKICYEDPERQVPSPKNDVERGLKPKVLEAVHKDYVINFIDENATTTVSDVMDSFTDVFSQLDLTNRPLTDL